MHGALAAARTPAAALPEGLSALVGALTFEDLGVWGGALGALVGSGLRVRREHVESAMRRAGIPAPARAASEMYASLGTSAVELLWLAASRRKLVEYTHIETESASTLERARLAGKGVVLAASHTGNWDWAACAMAERLPLLVVTKRLSVGFLDAFWQRSRAGYGVVLVEARGALARASAHLASGGAVAMMIDQVPSREEHAVRAPFLGEDAWVDRAPFVLAAKTGAPLLVSVARRAERGHVLSIVHEARPPLAPGDARLWVQEQAACATRALDTFVRAHPSEWLWMHRRWRRPPARRVAARA